MTRVLFSPLIERAMRVAACCHRTHNRKASDLPLHLASGQRGADPDQIRV